MNNIALMHQARPRVAPHGARNGAHFSGWLAALAVCVLSGCSTVNGGGKSWRWPWSEPKTTASEYGEPVRMAVIWTPDVLTVAGKPPTRGFGGRIYFYNDLNETVPVDGQLTVFGFDDTDQDQARRIPDRRFAFTPEQFTAHFSSSELGASYSVWIPWDYEQEHKTISLLPVFTSVNGNRVIGQQTINVLRGVKSDELLRKEDWRRNQQKHSPVAQVGYDQQFGYTGGQSGQSVGFQTTTIDVPHAMARRMQTGPVVSPSAAELAARHLAHLATTPQNRNWQPAPPPPYAAAPLRAPEALPPTSDPREARFEPHPRPAPASSTERVFRDRVPTSRPPPAPPYGQPFSPLPYSNP
jgi:hypothetical protein